MPFWNFYDDKTKNFCIGFYVIDNFYIKLYRFGVSEHCDVGEHVGVWYFIQLWISHLGGTCLNFFSSCLHRSHMRYWRNYSGSSMKFSRSLWFSVMRSEFIVGDGKLWSRYGWFFSNSALVIVFSFISSNNNNYSVYYLMCSSCASIMWVLLLVLPIWLVWSYVSSKCTDFTLGWLRAIVALGGSGLDVSVFLLKSLGLDPFLWLFWRRCSIPFLD